MFQLICDVPIPKTEQELEKAVEYYKTHDLSGVELLCQWQAIRDASLNPDLATPETDEVPGEESY